MASEVERLHDFCRRGHSASVYDSIGTNKPIINQTGSLGYTALHWASNCGHIDIVELLLHSGASINARTINGDTALHLAVFRDHIRVAQLLLQWKADKNIKNNDNKTPPQLAHSDGMREAVPVYDPAEFASQIVQAKTEEIDDDAFWNQ